MSKFNFDKMARALPGVMQDAMQQVAEATRDHFIKNFDNQSFDRNAWAQLARKEPPEKLIVTGELKKQTQNSIKIVTPSMAVLENTATDDGGRHYSNYHNEGTERMPARPIMKQDGELTTLQLKILEEATGKIWHIK